MSSDWSVRLVFLVSLIHEVLTQRGVEDAIRSEALAQAYRAPENAAERYVLAKDERGLVGREGDAHRIIDRGE